MKGTNNKGKDIIATAVMMWNKILRTFYPQNEKLREMDNL